MKLPLFFSKLAGSDLAARLLGTDSANWLAGWLGDKGERQAARYLRRQGFKILARRFRTELGELDLVARDGACTVFVEVKTRRSDLAGQPHEAVDRAKQAQLTRLALAFLKRFRLLEQPARFDIVSILWDGAQEPQIRHYRNAFEPPGRGQLFS
ncbi:MAG TPA: YraN family protein [Planctomycetaceae bacterium]|nr:YraN family protein [Planctomycetaceae bacterium]